MKKLSVLLITGVTAVLASCGGENTAGTAPSQAQIDSMVNARVEELRVEMEAKNDSIINALAQIKADSMIAAMKGQKPTASNVSRPKPTKPTTTKPTNTGKNDGTQGTNTGKKGQETTNSDGTRTTEGQNTGKR